MAASLTKTFSSLNLIRCNLRTSGALLHIQKQHTNTYVQNYQPPVACIHHRQFSTHHRLRKQNVVKHGAEQAIVVPEEEEFDVLYKKLVVEVKGHDRQVLRSYDEFVKQTAEHLEINISAFTKPKFDVQKHSVLKSVHIYKKHFTQFEQRTHYSVFEFSKLTGSTADTFLEYIQRNLPEGVAMKVTRHRLEKLPAHLKPPGKETTAAFNTS